MLKSRISTFFILFFLTIVSFNATAQVAVNSSGENPDGSAMLDIKSTSKGMLIPRMNSTNRTAISSPANGLIVYDTDTKSFWYYDSTGWKEIYGSNNNTVLSDGDNDTKVEVEQSADDDLIRFTAAGTEFIVFDSARIEILNSGHSIFLGENTGENDDYSNNINIGIGYNTLKNNTVGTFNVALGSHVLYTPVIKSGNIAIGNNSMRFFDSSTTDTSSTYNTAVGFNSMSGNDVSGAANTGTDNTVLGAFTLTNMTSGSSNVAIGNKALFNNKEGSQNTAIGKMTLYYNIANSRSTALGYSAMYYANNSTSGNETYNTALGYQALMGSTSPSLNSGTHNTAVGDNALFGNSSGSYNTALGCSALESNTYGLHNTALGYYALNSNNANDGSTAIGYEAMRYADNRTTGRNTYNTAVGTSALRGGTNASLNTGTNNTALGFKSLYKNTSGGSNVALGSLSLTENTQGTNNVAVGLSSMRLNEGGDYNIAVGTYSLYNNTSGNNNTASGFYSLYSNQTGNHNTAYGYKALEDLSSGSQNSVLGFNALCDVTTGSMNIAIGDYAGQNMTSGSYNLFIGHSATGASTTGSNQMNIADVIFGTDIYLSTAKIGIGTDSPEEEFDIRGDFQVKQTGSTLSANFESGTGDASVLIKAGGGGLGQIKFYDNGSYGGSIGYDNDEDRIFFYHAGNILIKNNNLFPGTHKGGDLGLDGTAWDDIYYDDLHNQGASAFENREVTKEIVLFPPVPKKPGSFDYKTKRGDVELDPKSLPAGLHDENSILTDEMVSYNYKTNYEQQLLIDKQQQTIKILQQKLSEMDSLKERIKELETLLMKNQKE